MALFHPGGATSPKKADETTSWWSSKLTKWCKGEINKTKVDDRASWWSNKQMKQQIDETASWVNDLAAYGCFSVMAQNWWWVFKVTMTREKLKIRVKDE